MNDLIQRVTNQMKYLVKQQTERDAGYTLQNLATVRIVCSQELRGVGRKKKEIIQSFEQYKTLLAFREKWLVIRAKDKSPNTP